MTSEANGHGVFSNTFIKKTLKQSPPLESMRREDLRKVANGYDEDEEIRVHGEKQRRFEDDAAT